MESISSTISRRGRASPQRRNAAYLRRFQLLRYCEVMRLSDVMETEIPIHGAGNFPTLKIRPSKLVQLVREQLELVGVKVHDIRLNGSAATHVLSDDTTPTYKDLDLIFTIDFPEKEVLNENNGKQMNGTYQRRLEKEKMTANSKNIGSSCSPTEKSDPDDYSSLDDSGYTSSGSSVGNDPTSPWMTTPVFALKSQPRFDLVHSSSVDSISSSSTKSVCSRFSSVDKQLTLHQYYLLDHQNWQEIKEVTMGVLHQFLPDDISFGGKKGFFFESAYVRKMVKVTHDTDRWSLISLNNNSGRNIELKFVQQMKRQFEFSVDSFQIILDTYLAYRCATVDVNSAVEMREDFHPTVVAESVYGDFSAALRHLRHRRICTHRPEEIRGGGLLRYCNLLAREFTPGECDHTSGAGEIEWLEKHMCARFFIDFCDIELQRRKLIGYLDSHFLDEDELKFQYLLVLRRVVGGGAACLMQHERTMILDLITALVRETFAQNVAKSNIVPASLHTHEICSSTTCQRRDKKSFYSLHADDFTPGYSFVSSRPITARISNGQSANPSTYIVNSSISTPKCGYYQPTTEMTQMPSCSWCCSCAPHFRMPFHTSIVEQHTHTPPPSMQPIYYSSNSTTCYYKPAVCHTSSM